MLEQPIYQVIMRIRPLEVKAQKKSEDHVTSRCGSSGSLKVHRCSTTKECLVGLPKPIERTQTHFSMSHSDNMLYLPQLRFMNERRLLFALGPCMSCSSARSDPIGPTRPRGPFRTFSSGRMEQLRIFLILLFFFVLSLGRDHIMHHD